MGGMDEKKNEKKSTRYEALPRPTPEQDGRDDGWRTVWHGCKESAHLEVAVCAGEGA
jgi:hypothetical protein